MPQAGKHEEVFRPLEGREVFRVQRFILVIGLVGLAISIGVSIVAFLDPAEIWGILFLSALFTVLSIPIVINYLFVRLYVDSEGIEYRNGLGMRRHINWRDVKAVYVISTGIVTICSERSKIKFEPVYRGADRLAEVVIHYCPHAFDTEAASRVDRPGVWTEADATVFQRKKFYCVVGIILVLAGIGLMFVPFDQSLITYLFFSLVTVWGVLLLLAYAISRIYLDQEKVAQRNLFGMKKQIYWKDVHYVKGTIYDRTAMVVYSDTNKIKISFDFSSFELLHSIIVERSPESALGDQAGSDQI